MSILHCDRFLILILFKAIGTLMIENSTINSTKPEAGLKLPSVGKQIVTFYAYQRIENGMTYNQVESIIGAQGEEVSRNKMDGVPGVMESIETVLYQWVNSNGSNMNAMFQNNKLVEKAQFGLN